MVQCENSCSKCRKITFAQNSGSVEHAAHGDVPPDKQGLLWVAQWLLGERTIQEMRNFFAHLMSDAMRLQTLPAYLHGYVLSLNFAPRIALFVVELFSDLFRVLLDTLLIPWLPTLILQLRRNAAILQPLIKEAGLAFPTTLEEVSTWKPRWMEDKKVVAKGMLSTTALSPEEQATQQLVSSHPNSIDALARLIGISDLAWQAGDMPSLAPEEALITMLLQENPTSTEGLVELLS